MKSLKQSINEASTKYEVYHQTYTSAIQSALEYAKTLGYSTDEEETATLIGLQSSRPKNGSTEKLHISIFKNDKIQRKKLQIQVTDLGNSFELNCYIN
jgi:hypothetical protein